MHPILFQTNFFTINTLWVFISIGVIAGVFALIQLAEKNGLKVQFISDHSLSLILWALIGARIVALLQHLNTYFNEFSTTTFIRLFQIWDKGLSFWGAIIGFLLYFYWLCKKHDRDFFKWLDVLAPAFIITLAISHIGAFFEGINYGNPSSLPWATNFESPKIKYTVAIHPTQIYAFLYSSALAYGIIHYSKTEKVTKIEPKGFIGLLTILLYNFLRFLEEFLRGDDVYMIFSTIRLPHIISAIITISTGIILYLRYNRRTK